MSINFDNSIVIGEFSYSEIFLSLKQKNPFLNIKFMDIKEAASHLEFEINDKFLLTLIKKYNIDYVNARKLAQIILFADENKLSIKKDLIDEGIIVKDSLNDYLFKTRNVYVFESDENVELISLLKRHNIDFKLIHFSDLEIEKKNSYLNNVYLFKDYYDQFSYYFSEINRLIIEEKVDPKKIYIYINEDLPFYFKNFENIFNLKTTYKQKFSLGGNEEVNRIINEFYKEKVINLNFEVNNEQVNHLKKIINDFDLTSFSFERGFIILKEILDSRTYYFNDEIYDGIVVSNKPVFKEGIYLFAFNFEADVFYKVYKDDNYFSDRILENIGCNPSFSKTLLSKRLMENFLNYSNFIMLGRAKMHLQDKIYDSEFIKKYGIKYKEERINKDGLYSESANNLLLTKFKDDYALDNDEIYKNYDNSFKKFKFEKDKMFNTFSTTILSEYAKCPFSYYVQKVLGIYLDSDTYYADLGSFLHKIMEKCTEEGFNFDLVYDELLENWTGDTRFKFILKYVVKEYFRYTFDVFHSENMNKLLELDYKVYHEVSREKNFSVNDISCVLRGKIDLIITDKDGNGIIVDYKSGSSGQFDSKFLEFGYSLQLPLYSVLMEDDTKIPLNLKGLYISKILLDPKEGVNTKNIVSLTSYTNAFKFGGTTGEIEDFYPDYKNMIKKDSSAKGTLTFDEVLEVVRSAINLLIERINDFDFEIMPTKTKENDDPPCKYCPYRPLCYKKEDYRILLKGDE